MLSRRAGAFSLVAALTILAAMAPTALAAAGQHATLASFQAATRGSTLLEPFNGPDMNLSTAPFSGNGFSGTVSASPNGLARFGSLGIGSAGSGDTMQVAFNGRPVSAFAATLFVVNGSFASVGGTMTIQTNSGETFSVNVPVGGTFFGFTTSQPFTSMTIEAPPFNTTEFIDNAYIGVSASAPELADQCADAVTITAATAAVYPFTTVGGTAQTVPGVCDGAIDTGPDVWIRYVAPVNGTVVFNTCGCTFDSILRVFASCTAAALGANIACNDDFCSGGGVGLSRASQVTFRVVAGEDYLVRVSGYNGASGSGNLNFSISPDCAGDFNHNGGKEVQDIFDFLASWFSGC